MLLHSLPYFPAVSEIALSSRLKYSPMMSESSIVFSFRILKAFNHKDTGNGVSVTR